MLILGRTSVQGAGLASPILARTFRRFLSGVAVAASGRRLAPGSPPRRQFRTQKGRGRPRPFAEESREETLRNRRDRAAGRLVEADLHVPQPGVVVVPPVGKEVLEIEDPGVGELDVARVANAVVIEVEAARGAEDVGDVLPLRFVAAAVGP